MDLPEVIGLAPEDARARVLEAGWTEIDEIVTAPPRRPLQAGEWRVVQVRQSGVKVELVIARFPTLVWTEVK